MNAQLSANSTMIMKALMAGPALSKMVSGATGLALPVVTGSLAGLKKNGFVEVLDTKELKLTQAGVLVLNPFSAVVEYAKPAVKKLSKGDLKAAAAKIAQEEANSKRAVVIKRFIEELGMSPSGASTYHYNLMGNKGQWK